RRRRHGDRPGGRFAALAPSRLTKPAGRADAARARRPRADGGGPLERRHLPATLPQPEDGRVAREQHLPEARPRAAPRRPSPPPRGAGVPPELIVAAYDRARRAAPRPRPRAARRP